MSDFDVEERLNFDLYLQCRLLIPWQPSQLIPDPAHPHNPHSHSGTRRRSEKLCLPQLYLALLSPPDLPDLLVAAVLRLEPLKGTSHKWAWQCAF